MVFEGENVVLDEDVIKKPDREFFPTFQEWLGDGNVEQVTRFAFINGTTNSFFTVPNNFTLFITSIWMSGNCAAAGAAQRDAQLDLGDDSKIILGLRITGAGTNQSNSLNYTMPLKVETGRVVRLSSDANFAVSCGFQGFLLPKKISIR